MGFAQLAARSPQHVRVFDFPFALSLSKGRFARPYAFLRRVLDYSHLSRDCSRTLDKADTRTILLLE